MDTRFNQLARSLWPYLQPYIEPMLRRSGSSTAGGGATGGAPSPHALNSTHHSGTLGDAQAPQFLLADGSRDLTGNLAVDLGVTIDGVDLNVHAADADAHHDRVTVTAPIALSGQLVSLTLATDPGLENSSGLRVKMPSPSGLTLDSTGVYLADAVAGAGLTITSKVMAVGAGDGIAVAANSVAVDLATDPGLEISSAKLRAKVSTGILRQAAGLLVDQAFSPTWTGTHQFNVDPQINANLDFIGANRSITNSGSFNLTMAPGGDLILDPTGNVQLPDAQELRTTNYSDSPSGITGLRMWDRGSNYRQLTTGAIKADELFVRVFVADEVRIDRGEEYWSKSYGYVETDFVTPADEATVDVWFEDAPALGSANLFAANDALMFQTIDWGTGIVIQRTWYQVVSKPAADTTNKRQQWRIRRKVGGTTGYVIKKGSLAVDFGQLNQGRIYLSGLDDAGGPFIKMGQQTTAITTTSAPLFTDYVTMGNLNGVGGIAVDTWGFAAAKNLGTSIGSGFEGIVIDPTNGVRLYNVDMKMYDGGTLRSVYNNSDGINFLQDTAGTVFTNLEQHVSWYTTVDPLGTRVASVGANRLAGGVSAYTNNLTLQVPSVTSRDASIALLALAPGGIAAQFQLTANASTSSDILLSSGAIRLLGNSEVIGTFSTDSVKAKSSSGLTMQDDGGNVGLKVKDGGTLELASIDSNLVVSDGYYTRHGHDYRYIAYDLDCADGHVLVRLAMASNYKSALVRVVYVERPVSSTTRLATNCQFAVLRQAGTSPSLAIYTSDVSITGTGRRIRAQADTVNGYIDFYLTDTTPTDVATGTYNTVFVEIIACTSSSSSTGFTVTFDP